MLAVRLHARGEGLILEEVALPEPRAKQVRIRVAGCGVCHTDLHIARGEVPRVTLPITLGHEVSGWVDAWGPEAEAGLATAGLRAGDPVLVFGGWGCGECADCLSGEEQRCTTGFSPGFQVDGGYAEAMLVPEARHLLPLGGLDPMRAAPLADAGLTPFRAVRRAAPWLTPGARVVILVFGGLGQFALQYLRRTTQLRVVVCDQRPEKVELALAMGANAATDTHDAERLTTHLAGPADAVFDFVGTDATLGLGAALLGAGGLLMVVGEAGGELRFGFARPAVESWVTTTAWGSIAELREVIALASAGELTWDVEPMPLAEAPAAHARLASGEVTGRIVLVPGKGN
jgi:alcohol dehydrogenase, propanol-preferring